jgi:hypothetical protein
MFFGFGNINAAANECICHFHSLRLTCASRPKEKKRKEKKSKSTFRLTEKTLEIEGSIFYSSFEPNKMI